MLKSHTRPEYQA